MKDLINKISSKLKAEDLTIDLSSGSTVIYQQGVTTSGIKVNEPAVLVIEGDTCIAFGKEAEDLSGLCPSGIDVIRPIRKGVVAEPNYCEQLLRHYLKTLMENKSFYCMYPNVLAVVPHNSTATTQKTMTETLDAAGAKGIALITTLQAAAKGIGNRRDNSGTSIIINLSKDFTEIGIISLSKIHYATTIDVGTDDFCKAIIEYIRTNSEYTIGYNNAKKALDVLGTAYYLDEQDSEEEVIITGLLKRTSVPENLKLTKLQVFNAIAPSINKVISGLLEVLEKAKEDMAHELKENGVTIVGTGATVSRLEMAIEQTLNIKARIHSDHDTCILRGAAEIQRTRYKK